MNVVNEYGITEHTLGEKDRIVERVRSVQLLSQPLMVSPGQTLERAGKWKHNTLSQSRCNKMIMDAKKGE